MNANPQESDGATRVAYILGVPLAENVVRQWPQMGEIVRTSRLIAEVEGNFPELTLEVGRRLQLDDVVVVEWTGNYGDGRLYRNVTIGELKDGQAVRVTDYWGEPTMTPEWRQPLTDRLDMYDAHGAEVGASASRLPAGRRIRPGRGRGRSAAIPGDREH